MFNVAVAGSQTIYVQLQCVLYFEVRTDPTVFNSEYAFIIKIHFTQQKYCITCFACHYDPNQTSKWNSVAISAAKASLAQDALLALLQLRSGLLVLNFDNNMQQTYKQTAHTHVYCTQATLEIV